jgi:hypothetical protein
MAYDRLVEVLRTSVDALGNQIAAVDAFKLHTPLSFFLPRNSFSFKPARLPLLLRFSAALEASNNVPVCRIANAQKR